MKQYCRYCEFAIDYGGDEFICVADAPCGANTAGKQYNASKAKHPNKCPHFAFINADIFRTDGQGNFAEYKPRAARDYEQLKMEITKQ